MLARSKTPGGSAGLITALTIVMLGAMAFAIPAAPIRSEGTAMRGYLVGHGRFSARLAEQLARSGYTYLAVDLTTGESRDWSEHFEEVSRRRFPVWGWIELDSSHERGARRTAEMARAVYEVDRTPEAKLRMERAQAAALRATAEWKIQNIVPALNLTGLYVYGPDATEKVQALRARVPGMRVVPVVYGSGPANAAIAMEYDEFVKSASGVAMPVLIADRLDMKQVELARATASGDYLVSRVPILK